MGLSKELEKEWTRVNPKPDSVNGQIALLGEIGQTIENHEKLEANLLERRDRDRPDGASKGKSGKSRKNRNSRFSSTPSASSASAPSSAPSFQKATQGVSKEVIAERKKEGACLRCGRSGHRWSECRSKEAYLGRRKETYPGKRKELEGETKPPASKKHKSFDPKTSTSGAVAAKAEPNFEGGRIIEIPEDEDEFDIDLWGDT
jgi:hypothetical protein